MFTDIEFYFKVIFMLTRNIFTSFLFLKTLLIFCLLLNSLQAKDNSQKISLQLLWKHQFQFAGYYIAKEKGYYESYGLDVSFKEYESNTNIYNEVMTQESDFGVGRSGLIIERVKNNKNLLLLAAIYQNSPLVLHSKKREDINVLEDIKGKRVMTLYDLTDMASISAMLISKNIQLKDYIPVPHSFDARDLVNNKVDLMVSYISNEPYLLQEQGVESKLFNPSDFGFNFYSDILFTSQEYNEKNPDTVRNFRKASLKGWQYAFENMEEAVNIIFNKYNSQNKTKEALLYEAKSLKKLAFVKDVPLGDINIHKLNTIAHTYFLLNIAKNSQSDLSSIIYKDNGKSMSIFNEQDMIYFKNKKEISLCIDPHWMPFESFNKKGQHIGLSADLFDLFREIIPIPIHVKKTQTWKETLELAQQQECDLVSLAMQTPERDQYLNFTEPYLDIPLVLATKNNVPFVNDFSSLAKKKIGIPQGYAFIELLKNKYPSLNIVEVKNIQDGLKKVVKGELFGYIGTLTSIGYAFQKDFIGELKIAGKFDESWTLGTAVRKDDQQLLEILEKAIVSLNDETKQKLINNWLNIKFEKGTDYQLLAYVLAVVVFIIALFVYRQYFLNKQNKVLSQLVKEKTQELQEANKNLEEKVVERTKEQNQLLALFDEGKITVFKWNNDENWSVEYVSNNVVDLFGYSKKDFLDNKIDYASVLHLDDKNRVMKETSSAITDNARFFTHAPYRIITKNNDIKWLLESTLIVKDEYQTITHFLACLIDITNIKQYELEITDMQNRFQLAISGANDGLWDWNVITNEVYFSPRWKSMLGYEDDEIKDNLEEWSSRVHPEDVTKTFEDVHLHLEGKTDVYHNEHRMKHKDGSWIWILDRGKVAFDENNNPLRMVGFHTDITQKKEYENNLESLVEQKSKENIKQFELLQQQSKLASMGEMVGAIAHQWRQPLNALAIELQFIEDDYEDGILDKKYLEEFSKKNMNLVNFMSKTIDDFRNFFTVDKVKSEFSIHEKINEVMNMLSPQMKNHEIEVHLSGSDFLVLGLQGEFQQVILNILNNAKDAFLENEIKQASIDIKTLVNNNQGVIEISDNAGGIPKDVIDRVFEPYFTTKEQGKGTGLGLYMSKMIIDSNFSATLTVNNYEDGAQFKIIFDDVKDD